MTFECASWLGRRSCPGLGSSVLMGVGAAGEGSAGEGAVEAGTLAVGVNRLMRLVCSAGCGRFSGKSRAASGAWRAVDERSAEFAGLRGWFIGVGGEIVVGVLQVVFVRYATRFVGVAGTSRWRGWGIVV